MDDNKWIAQIDQVSDEELCDKIVCFGDGYYMELVCAISDELYRRLQLGYDQ